MSEQLYINYSGEPMIFNEPIVDWLLIYPLSPFKYWLIDKPSAVDISDVECLHRAAYVYICRNYRFSRDEALLTSLWGEESSVYLSMLDFREEYLYWMDAGSDVFEFLMCDHISRYSRTYSIHITRECKNTIHVRGSGVLCGKNSNN